MQLFHPANIGPLVQNWGDKFQLVEVSGRPAGQTGFYLWHDGRRLQLCRGSDPKPVYLRADDFSRRAGFASALARACGVSRAHRPHVVDAMAGLGTDGLTLAALGCQVTLFEVNPGLWALLDDFLTVNPMPGTQLHCLDSLQWLQAQTAASCDTLYLDPLFPARAKHALPGKAMQYVRALSEAAQRQVPANVLAPNITAAWIDDLTSAARGRVVLKRRLRDAVVGQPAWQIKERIVRYDVYRGTG
jgi:16S rRNA (guanine1516-N2)-methyltransferase